MPNVIFIGGSINSGKSTTSALLQKKLKNTALIELDAFHEFIDWMPIDQALELNYENAFCVIKNFLSKGLNCIVVYPMSKETNERFVAEIKPLNAKIFSFTLNPNLETVLKDRGNRKLLKSEKKRIKYHYEKGINNPGYGTIIDNTDIKPEEAVEVILKKINSK